MSQTIALGADHGGFEAKQKLIKALKGQGYQVVDMGATTPDPSDYPIYGFRVAEAVSRGQAQLGVLLCRSGNGMSMAANKVPGVRAAIANNSKLAELARQHNDANVLILGNDYLEDTPEKVLDAFLKAKPEDGRHARRVELINSHDQLASSGRATDLMALYGQSPWLDDISDMLITSGKLKDWMNKGVRGVTSNPTIFEKAINSGQGRYAAELVKQKAGKSTAEQAYEELTTYDIRGAADVMRPLYDSTGGDDGFVSLEVLPSYAHEEEKSFQEALRLFKLLDRPNVMIKIPGTEEGIRAFRRATAAGVNVNVTLIFSRESYNAIARAYIAGLNERRAAGKDVSGVRSVASVFVSRIDTAVDKTLSQLKEKETDPEKIKLIDRTLHTIAIANTKVIYQDFKSIFYGPEFAELAELGASPQRPLWGSTGMKDPNLRDVLFVEELVGPMTVNTIPTKTLEAVLDHGRIRAGAIEEDLAGANAHLDDLKKLGIDLGKVCDDLQSAGVKSFSESFDQLFASVQKQLA